jgi:hypothetical protein
VCAAPSGATPLEDVRHLWLLLRLLRMLQGGRPRQRWRVDAAPANGASRRPWGRLHARGRGSTALVLLLLCASRERLRERLQPVLHSNDRSRCQAQAALEHNNRSSTQAQQTYGKLPLIAMKSCPMPR